MLLLEQAAVPDEGGKVRAGGIVSDIDQGGVDLLPLLMDLAVDSRGAKQPLFLQTVRQGR